MATVERDLITANVVDLSTLAGTELGALASLASLAALEQEAVGVYDRAVPYYGLGAYPEGDHPMATIQLLLATIDLLDRHIRGE